MDIFKRSIELHQKLRGKIRLENNLDIQSSDDLALAYSPGVAAPCLEIHTDPSKVYDYTIKGNTVAILSDGSAVLGLGNIGAEAAIPVMEGKAMLFKRFAGINGFPICIRTQKTDEIIAFVKNIAPVFGGINLEDISAPRCFEIEESLQNIGIPVFHDDQHGTAIVVLAALINFCKLSGKSFDELTVVINGAGAAGITIARYIGKKDPDTQNQKIVKKLIVCDSVGIIHKGRKDLNPIKKELLDYTNRGNLQGGILEAILEADVFIGVSKADLLKKEDIQTMAKDPLILALANPIPEILPEEAYLGGALVVGTGRSDYPNQVNNVLAFPGIFKGALSVRAPRITLAMKFAAAEAIAACVENIHSNQIIPSSLDERVALKVAEAVRLYAF
ncbi:MAG: NADP-dependent malic enzyme [Bacteroidota bacterium]|nr:NADP-dependent malic enzyme [Bacteroidota bacterium]